MMTPTIGELKATQAQLTTALGVLESLMVRIELLEMKMAV